MKTTMFVAASLMLATVALMPSASAIACTTLTYNGVQECRDYAVDEAQEAAGTAIGLAWWAYGEAQNAPETAYAIACGFLETCPA